jgi:hypothetical protein
VGVFKEALDRIFYLKPEHLEESRAQSFGWLWTVHLPDQFELKVFFKNPDMIRRGKRWSMVCRSYVKRCISLESSICSQ